MSHELTSYHSVFNLFLTQWIMAILSKGCKPDNFESHSSLKLSFMNIRGLRSNFVECESNSPGILALCETNLDDSIDSGYFSVRGFCTGLISRKLCKSLLMFLTGVTLLSVLLLFPLSITLFIVMHGF